MEFGPGVVSRFDPVFFVFVSKDFNAKHSELKRTSSLVDGRYCNTLNGSSTYF